MHQAVQPQKYINAEYRITAPSVSKPFSLLSVVGSRRRHESAVTGHLPPGHLPPPENIQADICPWLGLQFRIIMLVFRVAFGVIGVLLVA